MPTFKLDGRDIPFEKGDTIIRAAHRMGIDIPHYCWHPGLSVAANCRMCLVEIAPPPGQRPLTLDILAWDKDKNDYVVTKKPKLQPACQMAAVENMEVKSDSSTEVAKARSTVQELLLLNHPVDCPICDQAGECRLQDYWLEHQGTKKRMRDEPIHKPKVVVFGPTIVYDAERCIVCTRCVRVSEELAKDPVLSVRERGNLNEIVVAPGRQLDHPYTLMTEYVCPVGALTSIDFRFKARVWFLRSTCSVCTGGAAALSDVKNLIAISTHEGPFVERASVVLPASSWAEADGTFVNAKGMSQESEKVITPQGASKPAFRLIAELATA